MIGRAQFSGRWKPLVTPRSESSHLQAHDTSDDASSQHLGMQAKIKQVKHLKIVVRAVLLTSNKPIVVLEHVIFNSTQMLLLITLCLHAFPGA